MTDTIQRTFRTAEEAREAGWEPNQKDISRGAARFRKGRFEYARILSPEMLKCVEVIEIVEWDPNGFCLACNGKKDVRGHAPDCNLDLALKTAGVR